MKLLRKLACLLVLLCFTTALAQDATCDVTVQQALADVEKGCAATGRNQACYGNVSMQATPRDGVADFTFEKTGDLANVADIDTLRLSALDSAKNTWGVALMKLQANLPDTLPGQNVTFLMFGDVQIQNAVSGTVVSVPLTAKSRANIRTSPSTSGQVAGSVGKGDTMTANGRSADSTWLRIQIPGSNSLGWVFASLVTPASDISTLSVVDASQQAEVFKPMQAFYFKTGITQTGCTSAPADGILIQTPKGVGEINLRANDVDIQLGSTAFFQAQPSGDMSVSVVEGEGHITSDGKTVDVPAGMQVTVPVDANLKATGAPSDAKPYDPALVANLPIQDLPLPITVAAPLTVTAEAPAPPSGNVSLPGLGNIAGMEGMNTAQFCAMMGQALAGSGMNKEQYLAQIQPILAYIPANQKAQVDLFMTTLSACP